MVHLPKRVVLLAAWNIVAEKPFLWRIWFCCCLAIYLVIIDFFMPD
jgi:hypothetical protein